MPNHPPIALQLYSIREQAKADLHAVLKELGSWGLDGVEFAGFHGHDAATVKAWLDEAGLKCPSTHTPLDALLDEQFDTTVAFHQAIGCDTILIPWVPAEKRDSLDACLATAEQFNTLLEKLRPLGLRTGFHVHHGDITPLQPPAGDGRSAWDVIADATPDDFIMQYDTANGMVGGADPVEPIRKHPGRATLLHLKEYGDGTGTLKGRDGDGVSSVGDGDIPWRDVIEAATTVGGTQWFIIEQEGHKTLDHMAAARRSLDNLKAMLA